MTAIVVGCALKILSKSLNDGLPSSEIKDRNYEYFNSSKAYEKLEDILLEKFVPNVPTKTNASDSYHYLKYSLQNESLLEKKIYVGFTAPISNLKMFAKSDTKTNPILNSIIKNKDFFFLVSIPALQSVDFIVRFHSNFPITLKPMLLSEEEFRNHDHFMQLFIGIYIGIIITAAFMNFIIFIWTLEKIYLSYTFLMVFSHLLGVMTMYNITNELFFENNFNLGERFILPSLGLMIISGLWFAKIFLQPSKAKFGTRNALNTMMVFGFILTCISFFETSPILASALDILSAVSILCIFTTCLISIYRKNISSLFFLIAYSCLLVGAIVFILQDNGIVPVSNFTRYSLMVGCLLEALIFTIALGLRFYGARKEITRYRGDLVDLIDEQANTENFEIFKKAQFTPVETQLSIMFIDVVGFSNTVKRFSAEQLFFEHRSQVASVKSIIRQHGGIIGGTGGDSILCYFGFDPKTKTSINNHCDTALNCAISIQRFVCERLESRRKNSLPLFPLRIGVESALTIIGDIGDEQKADITAIGDAINYARRLEESCSTMKIMISENFFKNLTLNLEDILVAKKDLKIKHEHRLLEAFEVSPYTDSRKIQNLRKLFLEYEGKSQKHPRWNTPQASELLIITDVESFSIINFSESGFLLHSKNRYLANNVSLEVRSFELDKKVIPINAMLLPFNTVVRWGDQTQDGFLHGVEIVSLNEMNKEFLFDVLSEYLEFDKSEELIKKAG